MSVNSITKAAQTYDSKGTTKIKAEQENPSEDIKQSSSETEVAAIYEKGETTPDKKPVYQKDTATIERLMAEADKRTQALRDLVEKMLLKQGQTVTGATDIYALLREGKVDVDPETRAQAQKDIAEDGYWGVNQTSDRLVSFAKALTGGDPSKADEMMKAVKKGFEQATKAWGADLPDISKKTLEAAIGKLEAWRDGKEETGTMSSRAEKTFINQVSNIKTAK